MFPLLLALSHGLTNGPDAPTGSGGVRWWHVALGVVTLAALLGCDIVCAVRHDPR